MMLNANMSISKCDVIRRRLEKGSSSAPPFAPMHGGAELPDILELQIFGLYLPFSPFSSLIVYLAMIRPRGLCYADRK